MELVAQLLDRGLSLDLRSRRRDRNTEADALTSEDFSGFDLSRRVEASGVLDGMICLPELSAACSGFQVKLVSLKAQGPLGTAQKEVEGLRPMVSVAQAGCCVDTLRLGILSAFHSTSRSRSEA